MGNKSTSSEAQKPLVPRIRKVKESWWSRRVTRPLSSINIRKLFAGKRNVGPRSVFVNTPVPAEYFDKKGRALKTALFSSNQVITSKYTIITFVPLNLYEQFHRVANCFFLAIAILQFFSLFSTISPGLVILPLLAVLAITMLKYGYEDLKRHQADRRVNNSVIHVLGGGEWQNANPMEAKERTFVPKLPMRKGKKAKTMEAKAKENLRAEDGQAMEAPPEARPTGPSMEGTRPRAERLNTQVTDWEEDPDAVEAKRELGWHKTIWEDVKVGDIVKVYDNEQFPADIVICATSEEENVCYIETKNLDGETNLKSRHAVNGLSHLTLPENFTSGSLRIDIDAPEVNMFRLNGAAVILGEEGADGRPDVHPITLETTLLRGCVLRNTAWVVGIVAFTGKDTKIVQNSGATPTKRSKVEREMNPQVWLNLGLLGVIATVCAIVDHFNEKRWYAQDSYWTLYDDRSKGSSGGNPSINGLVTWGNALITFQNIVPISLYISIEFVRSAQALYIYWDDEIKQRRSDGVKKRTLAKSWNLSDDLGQIEYVFSDKTGTLTQNAMVFRQCSVGGRVYKGEDSTSERTLDGGKSDSKELSKGGSASSDSDSSNQHDVDGKVLPPPKPTLPKFRDLQLTRDLEDHQSEQSRILHGFFAVLGLCHTVLAAENEDGSLEYKAQSPDEAALVQSAADVGFVFRGRDRNIMRMSTPFSEVPDEYELLHVLEFSSARKRMSVILRKLDDDGRLFLLSKGADNVIFERLRKDQNQSGLRSKTDKDLQFFASEGLRTLVLAYKVLDSNEYEKWARDYHDATVALQDREDRIEEVSSRIESDLVLLGATAIEDKLQDGVPECISDLKRAGIKVWVATGDKLETAVAIGYTTHLLTAETNLIVVREGTRSIQVQLREALEAFFDGTLASEPVEEAENPFSPTSPTAPGPGHLDRINTGVRSLVGRDNGTRPGGYSLVIDGHALTHAFDDLETSDLLLALSTQCETVICCRVSPLQKAQIVRLIRDNLGVMCLAIGDGANDVSMIQAADVGVGISGEEGLQAVNSSDYAIAQFRYLKRLLLVHGHWSYYRNSTMILNFFYKNIVNVGTLFWFQIYCGWSTTYVFSYTYLLFWNIFWTLLPVIAMGMFERNIDAETLMALPELYRYGREQRYFGLIPFLYYIFEAVYQTAIIFFFINYTYVTTTARGDGWNPGLYEMSTTMAISAVMVANLFNGLNIHNWNWWVVFAVFFGQVLVWVYTAIFSIIQPGSFYTGVYGNDVFLFRSYAFWFGFPFVIVLALLPRYLNKTFQQNFFPTDIDTMRIIRAKQPHIDVYTDPMLGGKLRDGPVVKNALEAREEDDVHERSGDIPLSNMENGIKSKSLGRLQSRQSRPSDYSQPSFVRTNTRGSGMDMSTGLAREQSRGFDFTMEEGGVAVRRIQSRLSDTSSRPRSNLGLGLRKPRPVTGTPFGMSKLRERAGSVISTVRGRAGTTTSRQSGPETPGKSRDATGRPAGSQMRGSVDDSLAYTPASQLVAAGGSPKAHFSGTVREGAERADDGAIDEAEQNRERKKSWFRRHGGQAVPDATAPRI